MQQKSNDDHNKEFTDKSNISSKDEIEETKDWLNEHGQPDFEYLQSLVADGSPEALEKLKSIAEDLGMEYDPNVPAEELIERIRAVVQGDDGSDQPTT
jgi:hypothetical protein